MSPLSSNTVRVLTLVSGVLALVLSNIGAFNLPDSVRATISAVGGLLLAVLALLEHPTTQAAAGSKPSGSNPT